MNQGPGPAKNYLLTDLSILRVVPLFPGGGINSDACFLQITFYGQITQKFNKAASLVILTLENR